MNQEIKAKWVEALRSGQFSQIQEYLRRPGQGHCCLGVLAEVNGAEWDGDVTTVTEDDLYFDDGTGLLKSEADQLARLNDNGATFAEIADYIEANL